MRNSSNLRHQAFLRRKTRGKSHVPSNLMTQCPTSCSSFPFPLLSTLSIAACTSHTTCLYNCFRESFSLGYNQTSTETSRLHQNDGPSSLHCLLLGWVHSQQTHAFPVPERSCQPLYRLWASLQYAAERPQFRDVNISTLVHIAAIENCLPQCK